MTIDNGEDYRKPTTLGRSAFESAVRVLDELEQGDWTAAVFTGKPFVFCVGADIDEFARIALGRRRARGHPRRATSSSAASARCRSRPSRRSTARRSAAGSSSRCTAPRARSPRTSATSAFPRWRSRSSRPGAARSSCRGSIGPEAAAKVIVLNPLRQNKLLTAPEALELGIADRLLEPVEFVDESLAVRPRAREQSVRPRRSRTGRTSTTVLRKARSRVDDAVHGATRAPYVALDLIAGAQGWSIEEGYAAEEDAMAELLVSPQAQASAYAFTVVERRSKRPPELPDAKPRRVQKVGIVGAGLMATQLATLFLRRLEVPVVLRDIEQSRVDEALADDSRGGRREEAVPRDDRRRRHRLGAVRGLRPRARSGLRGARREARGVRGGPPGRARARSSRRTPRRSRSRRWAPTSGCTSSTRSR